MTDRRRLRNALPPLYGLAIIVGVFVGGVGPITVIGAMLLGIAWPLLSGGPGSGRDRDRGARRARRTARRGG